MHQRRSAAHVAVTRHRRRNLTVIGLLAAGLGLVLRWRLGFSPLAWLVNQAQSVWLLFTTEATLNSKITAIPGLALAASWLAAPVALAVLALALARTGRIANWVDRIAPPPPTFVFNDLDLERRNTMSWLERSPVALVGRDDELSSLVAFLERGAGAESFAWQLVLAPTGTGKTRLAIEWLAHAAERGWDYGFVDKEQASALESWRPRRPTALVLDEARTTWGDDLSKTLRLLADAAQDGRPVRVLALAQHSPLSDQAAGAAGKSAMRGAVSLAPLCDEAIVDLTRMMGTDEARTPQVLAHSAGRPRAAIILANAKNAETFDEAMAEWAERVVPELRNDDADINPNLAIGIIAMAMGGPMPTAPLLEAFPDLQLNSLQRFNPGVPLAALEQEIPAFQPEDLGLELAYRCLFRIGPDQRRRLIEAMAAGNPHSLDQHMGAMWRDRPHLFWKADQHADAVAMLRGVEGLVNAALPDRLSAVIQRSADLANAIDTKGAMPELQQVADFTHEVERLATSYPLQPSIWRNLGVLYARRIYWMPSETDVEELEHLWAKLENLRTLPESIVGRAVFIPPVLDAARFAAVTLCKAGRFERALDFVRITVALMTQEIWSEADAGQNLNWCVGSIGDVSFYVGLAHDHDTMLELAGIVEALWPDPLPPADSTLFNSLFVLTINILASAAETTNEFVRETIAETWLPRCNALVTSGAITRRGHPALWFDSLKIQIDRGRGKAGSVFNSLNPLEARFEDPNLLFEAEDFRFAALGLRAGIRQLFSSERLEDGWHLQRRMLAILDRDDARQSVDMQEQTLLTLSNAMHHLGHSGYLDDMNRMAALAYSSRHRFDLVSHALLRSEYAKIPACAYSHYAQHGRLSSDEAGQWRKVLAQAMLDCRDLPEILTRGTALGLPFLPEELRKITQPNPARPGSG